MFDFLKKNCTLVVCDNYITIDVNVAPNQQLHSN
jgi:hypothetical protein